VSQGETAVIKNFYGVVTNFALCALFEVPTATQKFYEAGRSQRTHRSAPVSRRASRSHRPEVFEKQRLG